MNVYLWVFFAVAAVSLVSFVGAFTLALREDILRKYTFLFMSLAVGALLGDAFIHLIPEALAESGEALLPSLLVIGGILLFFSSEKFLHWHHHGEDKETDHIHPVGKLILFSAGLHNLIDGVLIGASFLVSVPLGIATTLAVILPEIPQALGDFAVLIHAGYSKKRALWLNFLSALLSLLGAGIVFLLGEAADFSAVWVLPIAAGGFIYIATADLIPELNKNEGIKNSVPQIAAILLGVVAMAALALLE